MKGPGLIASIGLALLLLTAAIGTPADADLWGHLTFGRDTITTGHIIQADQYSFTSDRPWVNHEWLAETSFAEAYGLAGPAGLVVFKLLIIGALFTLLWRHVRHSRPSASIAAALLTLAFVGTFWRTHTIRPQLFSVLFFAVLLIAMARADQGRRRALLFVPLLMAFWVNLHGGWIVGLGVLGVWMAARLVDRTIAPAARLMLALAGLGAVGATLLNPYGAHMWTFLAETVRLGRNDIEEWGSVLTHPFALGLPWAITLGAAALAFWRSGGLKPRLLDRDRAADYAGQPRRIDYAVIVAVLAVASFRVSRLDAFFALAVVILLAPGLVSFFTRAASRPVAPLDAVVRRAPPAPAAGIIAITAITVAAMLVPAARLIGPYATCLTIAGPWVPESDAGQFIAINQLKGRMLTWFDWGEYAIWHFGPDLQVSMDGRRETVYMDSTIQAHRRFYAADESASAYLRALNPDYIWLPKHLPIASRLALAGWTTIFNGPISVVFARAGAGPFQQPGASTTAMRCFPGP